MTCVKDCDCFECMKKSGKVSKKSEKNGLDDFFWGYD